MDKRGQERGALPHIHIGSQKIHNKLHAPTGLLINIYSPAWLESKDALCLKHVLCPKAKPHVLSCVSSSCADVV